MLNSTILEVIIGLIFLYLIFSLLATFVNEIISTFFKLRANHLKSAIKNMLDNDDPEGKKLFKEFYDHPLIQSFVKKKGKGFPSYLEPKKFAKVIIDIYEKRKDENTQNEIKSIIENLPKSNYLRHLVDNYNKGVQKIEDLEKSIEDWFNSVMDRTSGWYNRNIKKLTLLTAFIIAIAFNFDTIHVYQRLSKDSNARTELVMHAENSIDKYAGYVEKDTSNIESDALLVEKMDSLKNEINHIIGEEISSIEQMAGLGWEKGECKTTLKKIWSFDFVIKLIGWVLTAMAISLGAPFWFDLLDKIMKLRGTGKREKAKEA
jgi:predicted  nucleic acid-binding Zn-ribbon protein